jgi:hypothetical protein
MTARDLPIILCTLMLPAIAGCPAVPPQASELSIEIGNRVSAIEDSHIKLLNAFFEHKRKEIDRFVEDEWVPVFAENIFADPQMAEYWKTIVSENNDQDRLKFIVSTGRRLQEQINAKRMEFIKPLDDLERRIESRIRSEYNQVRAMNTSLTGLLISASKVTETRNRYLEMLGVTDQKISNMIDRTDLVVSNLLSRKTDAQEKAAGAKEYLEQIMSLGRSI